MKKLFLFVSLAIFGGILFSSCEKDDKVEPREKMIRPVNLKYYENDELLYEVNYEYNEAGQLTREVWDEDEYDLYEYNADGNVIKHTMHYDSGSDYETFEYEGDRIVRMNEFYDNSEQDYYSLYKYNDEGYVSEITCYEMDDSFYEKMTFKYDEKGNVTESILNEPDPVTGEYNPEIYMKRTYTYDDKHHIFKNVGYPFTYKSYVNNIIEEKYHEYDGYTHYSDIDEYSYTYNEDGYPTERIDTYMRDVIEYKEL